jgi:hypothetical protein
MISRRRRHRKVNTFKGISEFALMRSSASRNIVTIVAYNILQSDSWRNQRTSYKIMFISCDGLENETSVHVSTDLSIDLTDIMWHRGHIMIEGIDDI